MSPLLLQLLMFIDLQFNVVFVMQELCEIPPSFDRLVLMVIDGLPAEFVLGRDDRPPSMVIEEVMPYTQSLLASGMAFGYHAKAAPPTVTMPRLKVKDTVQVDYNVSRHLGDELNRTDWNLLILHYLGLDHVGHVGGRSSVFMGSKVKEMDEVIKMIHLSTKQFQDNDQGRTLLVVLLPPGCLPWWLVMHYGLQMVVSDHGMTENGNHGGSSYEETDSLVLLVGLKPKASDYPLVTRSTIHQVDISPTLALLFGVPIPKNNVGMMIAEAFDSLTDDQKLRILELNSWQLLRLLQVQIPGLSCGSLSCDVPSNDQWPGITECNGSDEEMLCCLFANAVVLHKSWKSKRISWSNDGDEYHMTVLAYDNFLGAASKWLSGRATYKPAGVLIAGVAAMVFSCLVFIGLLFRLDQEVYPCKVRHLSDVKDIVLKCHFDETYVLAIIFILVLSMGSSSMVEEEQYIWHFLTSTFYLVLLRKAVQSLIARTRQNLISLIKEQSRSSYIQVSSIILILVTGRIMRGWHQGGVNWAHLPDISKWLQQAGRCYVKSIQLVSWVLIMSLGVYSLFSLQSRKCSALVIGLTFLVPGALVMQHIIEYQDTSFAASSYGSNSTVQIIYTLLGVSTLGAFFGVPWLMPVPRPKILSVHSGSLSSNFLADLRMKFLVVGFRDSIYVIGWAYIHYWCLLQLLLQQPTNSMPVLFLLVQILASMCYCSKGGMYLKQWVEVAGLYYLGLAGHFAFGNTNTLATIDVAGAFIGISSHSTLLSGILMFIITYASPMLALLSMVMYMAIKETCAPVNAQDVDIGHFLKMTVSFPCLVPLGLNSIVLVAYTIVLLLMRNHLFVWSVFSPK
ncbi:hypothetical protein RHMOL_Rhmol10G0253800 [Rhododendron molle]|uniref:Uncharacterized protein n=1 Tax=Rhododendron molle TaxID=49168 RepID=A0ACC0M5U3_RHOML|nr:hypothetical protein RHMOL_Rhmol10G0253800 [Rhododendron molle]